jgi:hypothetical protein
MMPGGIAYTALGPPGGSKRTGRTSGEQRPVTRWKDQILLVERTFVLVRPVAILTALARIATLGFAALVLFLLAIDPGRSLARLVLSGLILARLAIGLAALLLLVAAILAVGILALRPLALTGLTLLLLLAALAAVAFVTFVHGAILSRFRRPLGAGAGKQAGDAATGFRRCAGAVNFQAKSL